MAAALPKRRPSLIGLISLNFREVADMLIVDLQGKYAHLGIPAFVERRAASAPISRDFEAHISRPFEEAYFTPPPPTHLAKIPGR